MTNTEDLHAPQHLPNSKKILSTIPLTAMERVNLRSHKSELPILLAEVPIAIHGDREEGGSPRDLEKMPHCFLGLYLSEIFNASQGQLMKHLSRSYIKKSTKQKKQNQETFFS